MEALLINVFLIQCHVSAVLDLSAGPTGACQETNEFSVGLSSPTFCGIIHYRNCSSGDLAGESKVILKFTVFLHRLVNHTDKFSCFLPAFKVFEAGDCH